MSASVKIERLTSRPQFLATRKAFRWRVGFTATRKVGGAVVRNRAKRRLREAARALVGLHGAPGSDYVLIARMGTAGRDWDRLLDDVKSALTRLATSHAPAADAAQPRDTSGQDR